MKDNLNLNGCPTGNAPSTQLKCDIVASKLNNWHTQPPQAQRNSISSNDLVLIDAVLMRLVTLVVMLVVGIY